ncbi:MAG: hypothetical protein UT42_C0014G0004 [Candidatus Falkowbacteria bacterium GW2011_GWA2_39_24]|uniref:Uncharacterized protein n=1 Tax=Candidatus Falkowbacteria bacterium GW2011_GWA2_39_24 TaxID=1618634 RepID=A0A0G0NFJ0_9BACT|nr:MAG: hypothetical protein UT42_C0014G0004 [Candidatus Falkowbacteria bacterium GW2011_GWA2_39_24]
MAKIAGKIIVRDIIKEVYYVLGGAMVLFGLMELIKPQIVIAYLNLNLIFVVWLLSGIILLILNKQHD